MALFVLALVAIVLGFIASVKRDRREADVAIANARAGQGVSGGVSGSVGAGPSRAWSPSPVPPVYAGPSYAAPSYVGGGSDAAVGMMAGMALGSAMSRHDTVIVDRGGYVGGGCVVADDPGITLSDGPFCGGSDGGIDIDFGD